MHQIAPSSRQKSLELSAAPDPQADRAPRTVDIDWDGITALMQTSTLSSPLSFCGGGGGGGGHPHGGVAGNYDDNGNEGNEGDEGDEGGGSPHEVRNQHIARERAEEARRAAEASQNPLDPDRQ